MSKMLLPDIRLDERVVIMTWADRGLGRIMALGLAEASATVVLASPALQSLKAVASEIEASGMGKAITCFVDITDPNPCRALVRETTTKTGRLDVLVNNARRMHVGPRLPPGGNSLPIYETDPEIYRETVTVNVIGTFFMTRAAAEHFLGQGRGKIINITTSVRHFYRKHESPYGVTKAGLEASPQIWARDLEGKNISVNSLLPGGSTDTDPNRQGKPGEVLLAGDIMNPLLIWLASTQSDGVTGCRFVGNKWDSLLPPVQAAQAARQEPVFRDQPLGTFAL